MRLSAGGLSESAVSVRGYNEPTESRDQLVRKRRPDPESTEEILAANNVADVARRDGDEVESRPRQVVDVADRQPTVSDANENGRNASLEITDPIKFTGPRRKSDHDPAVSIRLADNDENSAELVELIVEQGLLRTSVRPGEIIAGRYRVIEKVSHCGMGLVYKALDKRREKAGMPVPWVALKFARPATGDKQGTSSYLRQEFLKLSRLNHPNIVSVFDFDSDGLDFIVMDWLEGETLANLLTNITSKRVALDKAQEIVRSVASALAYAHSLGVVHGDVKPSNIFITDDRVVKLLDFGSSGESTVGGVAEPHWATRAYASCDVLLGHMPQPRDDVFALGVSAYCLLSGERPFGELDAAEAEEREIVPKPLPPDAQEHWPAVERALRFDAAARPANAGEFLVEFDDAVVEPGQQQAERAHLEHIAYGAIAIALMIALVAWTVGSLGGGTPGEQVALEKAALAAAAGRLVEPGDDSAVAWYSSVLASSPDNSEAQDGLERIAEHYLTAARQSLSADDPEAAADNLAIARDVLPHHYGIDITEDLIARYGKDLLIAARENAARDLEQAELLLARAESFLPAEDSTLVSVKAELEQYRLNARLESVLRGIDQRILAERLLMPPGNSALDLLREARKLAPGDRQVSLAADRIATALLFQAMFAISSGKLNDAERFINAAKELDVRHLALARAEYELAKARHDAVRSRGASRSKIFPVSR